MLGVSGRAMLLALLEGEADAEVLAELARGRLREKLPALRQALHGRVQPHYQVLITELLAHLDFLDASIARLHEEMTQSLTPSRSCGPSPASVRPLPPSSWRRSVLT